MQHWLDLTTTAYLDPGTGSYALQLLMAGIFGGMFALRQSWSEVKAWAAAQFGKRPESDPTPTAPGASGPHHLLNARHHGRPISADE